MLCHMQNLSQVRNILTLVLGIKSLGQETHYNYMRFIVNKIILAWHC